MNAKCFVHICVMSDDHLFCLLSFESVTFHMFHIQQSFGFVADGHQLCACLNN